MTKVSIAIPFHDTPQTAFYLSRLLGSVAEQTFTDYEICIAKEGNFARTHNAAMMKSKGEIVKILQMDDGFCSRDSLEKIVNQFDAFPQKQWLICGTVHQPNGDIHVPRWTDNIYTGNNRLGSVSTIAVRREAMLFFEEPLTWLVDCDWYYRMYLKYGLPIIIEEPLVNVDQRDSRLSSTLSLALKGEEANYLSQKYAH